MSNQINVWGRCVREPEVFYNEEGQVMVSFDIADNYYNGKEKSVNFFRCVAFGKRAEYLGNTIGKGMGIYVSGRLNKSKYTGQDGVTRTEDDILISNFEFTDKKENYKEEPETRQDIITAEAVLNRDGTNIRFPATLSIEYRDKTLNTDCRSDKYFKNYTALARHVKEMEEKDYVGGFIRISKSAYSAK